MALSMNKTRLAVSLTYEQTHKLEVASCKLGLSKSDVVAVALDYYYRKCLEEKAGKEKDKKRLLKE